MKDFLTITSIINIFVWLVYFFSVFYFLRKFKVLCEEHEILIIEYEKLADKYENIIYKHEEIIKKNEKKI